MAEKYTCEVAVFNSHANSRLPRPMLARKRKRTSPVYRQTLLRDAPSSTAHLKFPALKSALNDQPSRIPVPCTISKQLHQDETLARPQTSSAAYARRKPSGRSNLLHKIQTISIRANSIEEDSGFTKLQPLPAIGCLTSDDSLLNMEECSLRQLADKDRPKTPELCVRYSGLPLEIDSSCAVPVLERTQSPSLTNPSYLITNNIGESQIWEEEIDNNEDNQISDSEIFCMPLFEKMERGKIQHVYEDAVAERPKTSYHLSSHPEDEQFPSKPLVRSNTYDILPVLNEEESYDTKDEPTCGANHSLEIDDTDDFLSADSVSLEENADHGILLAIQTSPGDYIYGYFHRDNSLQSVLNFASEMRGCSYEGYRLKMGDVTQQPLEDLTQTIAESKLKHRNLLQIYKDDNECDMQEK